MAKDQGRALRAYWASIPPAERSEIMRERRKKARSPSLDPKVARKHRKLYYKSNRRAVLAAGHKKWAEEHKEKLYQKGKEISALPQTKAALQKCRRKRAEEKLTRQAKRKHAEALLRYQTNLNIKRIDDTDNDQAIDEFFGEMI